jgi:hypothetical protein
MEEKLRWTHSQSRILIAASSFGAIAEMAGGAEPQNRYIIASVSCFAVAMVIVAYLHVWARQDGDFDNRWNHTLFVLACVVYNLAIFSMLRYFSLSAMLSFGGAEIALGVVFLARHVIKPRRSAPSRIPDASQPSSAP